MSHLTFIRMCDNNGVRIFVALRSEIEILRRDYIHDNEECEE